MKSMVLEALESFKTSACLSICLLTVCRQAPRARDRSFEERGTASMIVRPLLVLLLSTPAAAYRLQSGRHVVSSPRATRSRAVTASADADAIAALKRSFYGAAVKEEVREEADDPPVGLLRDMPLCRWPWEVLPHHQRVIVVHEPQARYYPLAPYPYPTTSPPCHLAHLTTRNSAVHPHVREAARHAGAA